MGVFLFLLSQALSFSSSICEQTGFSGKACKKKVISCENLEARFPKEEVSYYKLREGNDSDFIRPLKESENGKVSMGTFGTSHNGNQSLRSEGYVTCSALAVVDANCDHASLSHFINVKPEILLAAQKKALAKNCKNTKIQPTVTLMLSSRTDARSGLNTLKHDGYYYHKLICEALREFPEANLKVVHSKKNMGTEFDDVEIKRNGKGEYSLILERKSARTNNLIQKEEILFKENKMERHYLPKSENEKVDSGF